jgi:hypothetical protein
MDVLLIERVCFGNIFTEPFPSNEHMRHNTFRVFENGVQRTFGPKRAKRQEVGDNCIMRGFILYSLCVMGPLLFV